jgi:hypothetical protein
MPSMPQDEKAQKILWKILEKPACMIKTKTKKINTDKSKDGIESQIK